MSSHRKKRRYKRYPYKTEFFLSSYNNSIKACVTDYSLKGFGFYIENPSASLPDQNVHFIIKDLNIEEDGKIVWSRKAQSRLEGGIERKGISGRLMHYPLADILLDLQRSEKSGIFEVTRESITKKIYIKNGAMVYAASNMQKDRFIEVLLRNKKITDDQYYQVIDISNKTGKGQGSVLVELGFLRRSDLILAVREQVEQIILSLFQWEDGGFTLIEGPAVPEKLIALKLSAASLIYQGIKSLKSADVLKNAIPPDETVLRYSADPEGLFQDIKLEGSDRDILHSIDGTRSIRDIVSESPLDAFETKRILYALLKTQIIDIKGKNPQEDTVGYELPKEPEKAPDPDFLEKVEDTYKKLENMDFYSFLNVERSASMESIKRAYYEAAKEFHPDKHLRLPSGAMKNKLNTIFSHLTEVYKVLSSPAERKQYDGNLAVRPPKLHIDNRELARIRYIEGKKALSRGDYSAAGDLFGQAVYLDSSVSTYHFNLGLTLEKGRKFDKAAKAFSQALRLDPANVKYLVETGYVYLKLGFYLRAKSTFEKALKIDPGDKRASEGLQEASDRSE